MRSALAMALVCLIFAPRAHADDSSDIAMRLGTIIGSEQFCGLQFDQNAIRAFIEKSVNADDMELPSTLSLIVSGTEFENKGMSVSSKTARCTQIARIARAYGFLK